MKAHTVKYANVLECSYTEYYRFEYIVTFVLNQPKRLYVWNGFAVLKSTR